MRTPPRRRKHNFDLGLIHLSEAEKYSLAHIGEIETLFQETAWDTSPHTAALAQRIKHLKQIATALSDQELTELREGVSLGKDGASLALVLMLLKEQSKPSGSAGT